MFKVNNRNSRTRSEICSKLTIKIPKRRQWRCFGFGVVVNFDQINAGWAANSDLISFTGNFALVLLHILLYFSYVNIEYFEMFLNLVF